MRPPDQHLNTNDFSRGARMDIRKVKKLIELLEESGISELEISEGEESVRISRHPRMAMQAPMAMGNPMIQAAPLAAAMPATSAGEHKPRNDEYTVTSPMVGTDYSAPAARSASRPWPGSRPRTSTPSTCCSRTRPSASDPRSPPCRI